MVKQALAPRDARLRIQGLTQQRLASRIGCAIATVSRAETTGRWPRANALRAAYLKALGLDPNRHDD